MTAPSSRTPVRIGVVVLILAALVFIGASAYVTWQMDRTAESTGSSTRAHDPGSIPDRAGSRGAERSPPLVGSDVPPAQPQR